MYEICIKNEHNSLCINEVDLIRLIRNVGYYLNKKREANVASSILKSENEKAVSREDFVRASDFYGFMAVKLYKLEELADRYETQGYDLENEKDIKVLFKLLDKIESDYALIIEGI